MSILIDITADVADLEQREDAAKTEKQNDEMAAKNLQAEVGKAVNYKDFKHHRGF